MSQFTIVKLENGQSVRVLVPDGMTEEQALTDFGNRYNEDKESFHKMAGLHQPQAGELEQGVMGGPKPPLSSWETIKDYANSIGSAIPTAGIGVTTAVPKVATGLAAATTKAFGGEVPSWLHAAKQKIEAGENWAMHRTQADYVPQSPGSDFAKDVTTGALAGAMTGGSMAPARLATEAAIGGGSAALGHAASNAFADPATGDPSTIAGYLASAVPYFGRAGLQMARTPGAAVKAGRTAMEDLLPQERQTILDSQVEAQRAGQKLNMAQLAPMQSTVGRLAQKIANLPSASQTQKTLRETWGGTPGQHEVADMIEANGMLGLSQNPQTAAELADRIRTVDSLRGGNVGTSAITGAGTHETGNMALGMEIAGPILPHSVKAAAGGMEFARLGAIKRLFTGPNLDMADQLANSSSLDEFSRLANTNTKLPVYRSALQGAFAIPGALQYNQTPEDK